MVFFFDRVLGYILKYGVHSFIHSGFYAICCTILGSGLEENKAPPPPALCLKVYSLYYVGKYISDKMMVSHRNGLGLKVQNLQTKSSGKLGHFMYLFILAVPTVLEVPGPGIEPTPQQ